MIGYARTPQNVTLRAATSAYSLQDCGQGATSETSVHTCSSSSSSKGYVIDMECTSYLPTAAPTHAPTGPVAQSRNYLSPNCMQSRVNNLILAQILILTLFPIQTPTLNATVTLSETLTLT